jgi:hypothetical protein
MNRQLYPIKSRSANRREGLSPSVCPGWLDRAASAGEVYPLLPNSPPPNPVPAVLQVSTGRALLPWLALIAVLFCFGHSTAYGTRVPGERELWLETGVAQGGDQDGSAEVGAAEGQTGQRHRFGALLIPFSKPPFRGGAILVHDLGGHPDWRGVIGPLRRRLPAHGWSTLSLQFPSAVSDPVERARLTGERLDAAVAWLGEHGVEPLVVIGHGEGGSDALHWLSDRKTGPVVALVAIGMPRPHPQLGGVDLIEGLRVAMLDLVGEEDHGDIIASLPYRREAAERGEGDYRLQTVAGADHFFNSLEDQLITTVRGWIQRRAAGKADQPLDLRVRRALLVDYSKSGQKSPATD